MVKRVHKKVKGVLERISGCVILPLSAVKSQGMQVDTEDVKQKAHDRLVKKTTHRSVRYIREKAGVDLSDGDGSSGIGVNNPHSFLVIVDNLH